MRALRSGFEQLALEISPGALFRHPPLVRFQTQRLSCDCGERLLVQKSRRKDVWSMVGPFVAYETVCYCGECGAVYPSDALLGIVPSGSNVAYDVLVFVGKALFQRHRTVQEVLFELALCNVRISASEAGYLGRKFIMYLARAHRRAVPRIRKAMAMTGGYILHLDAMHAGDAPALMTGLDGLSDIVLGNVKLPSEKSESIEPFLRELNSDFDTPIACVHDMGIGIRNAVANVFAGVPDFICHFHFLRDLGKDLLEPSYARLRKRLRKYGASSRLHALVRELAGRFAEGDVVCGDLVRAIRSAEQPDDPAVLPAAAAYALAQWALAGKRDGDGYGFPFDRPLLCFAERLLELKRRLPEFIDVFLRGDWRDNKPLYKLLRKLWRPAGDAELRRALKELRWRCALFDSLRTAMRIAPRDGTKGLNDEGASEDISSIKRRVQKFRKSLDRDPKLAADPLCVKMAEQIDKYGEKLFADPITVNTPNGPVVIQPQRTNNNMEQFFRRIRYGHRRRTGNDSMSRALQTMLADTPLVKNLDNPRYTEILLNSKHNLEELFAELDAQPTEPDSRAESDDHPGLTEFRSLIRMPKLPNLVTKLFSGATKIAKSN